MKRRIGYEVTFSQGFGNARFFEIKALVPDMSLEVALGLADKVNSTVQDMRFREIEAWLAKQKPI